MPLLVKLVECKILTMVVPCYKMYGVINGFDDVWGVPCCWKRMNKGCLSSSCCFHRRNIYLSLVSFFLYIVSL
uniref:Uncharacterized protein n=1 Tax=Picea glauca TaxID=3330 RepID=A0A101LVM5_PICGL|nr:hypothetical protein ABT39_MTgene1962 [Picea glauca]